MAIATFAPAALADSSPTPSPTDAGGATAPIGATGATGATGSTGSTGAGSGTVTLPDPTPAAPPKAPIVLGKHQSPDFTYHGPVFVQAPGGVLEPYVPNTIVASVSGGTVAGVASRGLPHLLVPGDRGEIIHGLAAAPEGAPLAVKKIIWAANRIIGRPYVFGGGHRSFISNGYDCSGTVSFALHGARLLKSPLDSGQFMSWGGGGQGQWVTILTNPGHAYLDIAGLRLDTSAADDPNDQQGPRWRPLRPGNGGYTIRHPFGL
ncbi:MAG TPA: hypothetical protein VHX66_05750 [Solirubrobacteraceae bacterium]|nr:hypothetical protein [Solirubrobacteraceae bacterium]